MSLIDVQNVSKVFRLHTRPKLLREQLWDILRPTTREPFYALRNVSLEIAEGESVAIIGANGAGKSTLLNIIAGLAHPDEGSVRIRGRVAALLELGSGFHPDLTGIENVALNAALLGFTEQQLRQRLPKIFDFAELGDFVHEPLRTYSSGMVIRLAFSIAVHVDPAILIVDEVLAVGDSHFQEKCATRIRTLRAEGKTLLCVSHSPAMIREYCDRAVWLHHGRLMMDGPAMSVLQSYTDFVSSENHAAALA
jgi:ABC-type polysaccharide/polyol phosphate transport system ATPase subunit